MMKFENEAAMIAFGKKLGQALRLMVNLAPARRH